MGPILSVSSRVPTVNIAANFFLQRNVIEEEAKDFYQANMGRNKAGFKLSKIKTKTGEHECKHDCIEMKC